MLAIFIVTISLPVSRVAIGTANIAEQLGLAHRLDARFRGRMVARLDDHAGARPG
jgi:hypothetical protein